jgi:hypothetical protein
MAGTCCHTESSAIPLIFGVVEIFTACADFLFDRGSGFLSAKQVNPTNMSRMVMNNVRT